MDPQEIIDRSGIRLGDTVEDTLTGYVGVAFEFSDHYNGCIQVAIQPLAKENKFANAMNLDIQRLRKVKDGGQNAVEWSAKDLSIGTEVRDTLSGFQGIVSMRILAYDGSTHVHVQPKVKSGAEQEYPKGAFFHSSRVEVVNKNPQPPRREAGFDSSLNIQEGSRR